MDIATSFVVLLLMVVLACVKAMPLRFLWWFLIGAAVGLIWEATHALVPDFLASVCCHSTASRVLYVLAHAIWDGLIMLCGVLLAKACGMDMHGICALLFLIAFGLGIEVVVEMLCNSNVWFYNDKLPANPVVFRFRDVNYTLWPLLEWILGPLIFWSVLFLWKD